MFEQEIGIVRNLDNLVNCLTNACDDLVNHTEDLRRNFEGLDSDHPAVFDTTNLDYTMQDVVSAERNAAKTLEQFDIVLARVIAERNKLGAVPVIL